MTGKIIVLEGIDGSGKNTQANLLYKYALSIGIKSSLMNFPSYNDTFFGIEVGNYLNGEFGALDEIHPKLAAMLYAGDRYEKRDEIIEYLEDGYLLIIDRYVPSNIAHQTAKILNGGREKLLKWIEHLEYTLYKLPKPDVVIFLDMPPTNAKDLVLAKDKRTYTDKKQDLHEEDQTYLERTYLEFKNLCKENKWLHIQCRLRGKVREPNEISLDIIRGLKERGIL